jgi:hypothetical protein
MPSTAAATILEHRFVDGFPILVNVAAATPAVSAMRRRVQPAASSSAIRSRTGPAFTRVAGSAPRFNRPTAHHTRA